RLLLERDDGGGERRIVERRREALSVGQHPAEELLDRRALLRACDAARYEEPREARDRIGVRACGISDRDAEVARHVLRRGGRRGRDALERRLDDTAGAVIDVAVV